MNRAANFTVWILTHFVETVPLAKIDKAIKSELGRRAEYALRFGIHAPSQFDFRAVLLPLVIALFLMSIFCLA